MKFALEVLAPVEGYSRVRFDELVSWALCVNFAFREINGQK